MFTEILVLIVSAGIHKLSHSVLRIRSEQLVGNGIHRHTHNRFDIGLCHLHVHISLSFEDFIPGRSHICRAVPQSSIHVKYK